MQGFVRRTCRLTSAHAKNAQGNNPARTIDAVNVTPRPSTGYARLATGARSDWRPSCRILQRDCRRINAKFTSGLQIAGANRLYFARYEYPAGKPSNILRYINNPLT